MVAINMIVQFISVSGISFREMRTGVPSVLNYWYSVSTHQKAVFIRFAEMVNYLFCQYIDCFDNENMKFKNGWLKILKWIICVLPRFVFHVIYANIAEACVENLVSN